MLFRDLNKLSKVDIVMVVPWRFKDARLCLEENLTQLQYL